MMKIGRMLSTLLLLLAMLGCHHNTTSLLPARLVGFWTTDEPRYEGRFMELYQAYVIIGTGSKEAPTVQAVSSVEAEPENGSTLYRITSTDMTGVQYKMALLYTPINGGELRFRHPEQIVWRRHMENSDPAAAPSRAITKTPQPTPPKAGR